MMTEAEEDQLRFYFDWANGRREIPQESAEELIADCTKECESCGVSYCSGWEPDPCIGRLPFVQFACCGHKNPVEAYVSFKPAKMPLKDNGDLIIRGPQARSILKDIRNYVDEHFQL